MDKSRAQSPSVLSPTRLQPEYGTLRLVHQTLLYYLDTYLKGIRFGRNGHRVAVVDHADDVTLFATHHDDCKFIRGTVQRYENHQ